MTVSAVLFSGLRLISCQGWLRLLIVVLVSLTASGAWAQNLVVSESGRALYSYPIAVPRGIAGLEPRLSLVYTNGGINGPMGVGWAVQGISQITRCPIVESVQVSASTVFKPKITGVGYVNADGLCLDGQRLIRVGSGSGNYVGTPLSLAEQGNAAAGLSANARLEFRTETDGFSRVFASGAAGGVIANGPATFTVQSKGGLIQVYGEVAGATDGVVRVVGGSRAGVASAWLLKSITDSVGNTMEFAYDNAVRTWGTGPSGVAMPGREWNLLSVTYGCNYTAQPGCTLKHKVEFVYDDTRSDKAEAYHLGAKVVSTLLLRKVVVSTAANVAVRNYQIGYTSSSATSRQLLTSIRECAGSAENKCFPATTISYTTSLQYASASAFNLGAKALASAEGPTITGDFNGDGKTDLLILKIDAGIEITETSCNNGSEGQDCVEIPTGRFRENELWLSDSNIPGKYNQSLALGGLARTKLVGRFTGGGEGDTIDIDVVDINGDGRADLMTRCRSANAAWCPPESKLKMWLSISDTDPGSAGYGQFVPVPNPGVNLAGPLFASGSTNTGRCREIDDGKYSLATWQVVGDAYWQDFDNDGRLDLVSLDIKTAVSSNCWDASAEARAERRTLRYYVGKGDGQFELKQTVPIVQMHRGATTKASSGFSYGEVVDLNGDGRSDLLFRWSQWIQDANGGFVERAYTIDPSPDGNPLMLGVDANGDGKVDVVLLDPAVDACQGTCIPVQDNPVRARLFVNDGSGAFFRDDRPLVGLKSLTVQPCTPGVSPCVIAENFEFGTTHYGLGSIPLDINDDGLTDFLTWHLGQGTSVYIGKAGTDNGKSDGTVPGVSAANVNSVYGLPELNTGGYSLLGGDFMGVASPNFIRMGNGGNNALYYRRGAPPDLFASVQNVSGARTSVTYSSTGVASGGLVAGNNSVVAPGIYFNSRPAVTAATVAAHTWPTYHAHPATWLVAQTQQDSATLAVDTTIDPGLQNKVVTAFAYAGIKFDVSGAGNLGFESVTKYFPYANGGMLATTTEYLQPLNAGPTTREGWDRRGFTSRPKCTFTRYDPLWVPNEAPKRVNDDTWYRDRNGRRVIPQGGPTEQPQGVVNPASRESDCFDADVKPGAWADQIVSMSTYTYCDLQVQPGSTSAGMETPCGTPSLLKRPYQYKLVDRTWNLNNRNSLVSKVETVNSKMTSFGDVRESTVTTTGFSVGGFASPQTYTKTNINTYFDSEDAPGERFINADKWILGRLRSSQVRSTVPSSAPMQDGSALSATARATQDPALTSTPPKLLRPEILLPILQLLLED
jgi:hypothetical protein